MKKIFLISLFFLQLLSFQARALTAIDCEISTSPYLKQIENDISFFLAPKIIDGKRLAELTMVPVDHEGQPESSFRDSGAFVILLDSVVIDAYFSSDLTTKLNSSNTTIFHGSGLSRREAWFDLDSHNYDHTLEIQVRHKYTSESSVSAIVWDLDIECTEPTSPPNLEFSSFSASRTNTSSTQDLISVSSTILNSGGTNTTSGNIQWYRSANSTISSFDTFVAATQLGAINAGRTGQSNPNVTVDISDYNLTGYYLGGCIDIVTDESDTADNCSPGIYFEVTDDAPITAELTVVSVNGTVTSTGINCPSDCTEDIEINSNITLTASADTNYEFSSWNLVGSCGNSTAYGATPHIIDFEFSGDCTATATFNLIPVVSEPPAPTPISPANNEIVSGTSQTLDWSNVSEATSYELALRNVTLNQWIYGGSQSVVETTSTQYTVSGLTEGYEYVWTLQAKNSAGLSANSTAYYFTITDESLSLLSVSTQGQGSISSLPSGINCPSDCTEDIEINSNITLTASADTNYEFSSWDLVGSCGNSTVQAATPHIIDFEFSGDCTATATFNLIPVVSEPPAPTPISPANNEIVSGTSQTLDWSNVSEATSYELALRNVTLNQWIYGGSQSVVETTSTQYTVSGLTEGYEYVWTLQAKNSAGLSANSTAYYFTITDESLSLLSVSTQGQGSISSLPSGIDCGDICSHEFTTGQKINIYAVADSGWEFDSWTGVSCVEATCEITLNDTLDVTASFFESTEVSTTTRATAFSPDIIEQGLDTYITIAGENLPSTMVVNIEGTNGYCVDSNIQRTSSEVTLVCNAQAFGSKRLYIKDQPNGAIISGSEHWYIDVAKPANTAPSVWVDFLPFQAYVGERLAITVKTWDHEGNLDNVQVDWEVNDDLGLKKSVTYGYGSDVQFSYYPQTSGELKFRFIAEDDLGSKTSSDIYTVNILPTTQLEEEVTGTPGKELASQNESACSGATVGNPVNPANGAKLESASLLSVNGLVPIDFTISYNSLIREQSSLGIGWDFANSHVAQITEDHNGDVIVHWSKNQVHSFTKNSDGSYTPQSFGCRLDNLTKLEDGRFKIVRRDRSSYIFNEFNFLSRIENVKGQGINFEYNSNGQLSKSIEPVSQAFIQYSYDSDGLLIQASTSQGVSVFFDYVNSHLAKVTRPDGVLEEYTYSDLDQIVTKSIDGVVVTTTEYDERGRVSKQEDAKLDNQELSFQYDESATQIETTITDKNGQQKRKIFDKNYQLLKETDSLNHELSYQYNDDGKPIKVTDAKGHITHFEYNIYGDITKIAFPDGTTIVNEYDENRNRIKVTDQDNKTEEFFYDKDNNTLTIYKDKRGHETSFTYDSNNRLVTETTPEGRETSYGYSGGFLYSIQKPDFNTKYLTHDADGRLITETDYKGNPTHYEYDGYGRVTKKIDALNESEHWSYTARGDIASYTDKKGRVTSYSYNDQGENIKISRVVDGEIVEWKKGYDGEGRLENEISPNGTSTQYVRDPIGRTSETRVLADGGTVTTKTEYDANNNVKVVIDALGNKVESEYDNMNRATSVTDQLNKQTKYEYDGLGRKSKITDPLNRQLSFSYNAESNLTSITHPGSLQAKQTFDKDGYLIGVVDPDQKTKSLTLNSSGQIGQESDFDGISQLFTYDANDLLSSFTNGRNQSTSFTYDELSRKKTQTDDVGSITYNYDEVDNVVDVTEGGITIHRQFDDLDRVTNYQEDKSRAENLGYQYDKVSNLIALTYPSRHGASTDLTIDYSYDELNRMTSVSGFNTDDKLATYEYDDNSRITKLTRGNGSVLTNTYDAAGRLQRSDDLDADGNIILTQYYHYDAIGKVIMKESLPKFELEAEAPQTINMTYGSGNELETKDGKSFDKDGDGNILEAEGLTLEFNARNQLVKAGDTEYLYNAEGSRIAYIPQIDGEPVRENLVVDPHHFSGLPQVLRSYRAHDGGLEEDYIYGAQGLLAQYSDYVAGEKQPGYYYFHYDYRGSVVAVSNEQGEVVARFGYSPYGKRYVIENFFHTPFGYNGRDGVMTDLNGLIHMRARYYSPDQRRFISKDPLRGYVTDIGSLNRYAYVGGDPVNFVDPGGKAAFLAPLALGGGALSSWALWFENAFAPDENYTDEMAQQVIDEKNNFQILLAGASGVGLAGKIGLSCFQSSVKNISKSGDGPVIFKPPPGATKEEIKQVIKYCEGCNDALKNDALSPTGRVSTTGELRREASKQAAIQKKSGNYSGHAGHTPDTTWTGDPIPFQWLDLTPKVNSSLGGQARGYPIGYKPTIFIFEK